MTQATLPPRLLVAGSINTDLVMHVSAAPEAGETVTGLSFNTFGGGKGANQAVAAARSGAQVAMLGGTGGDDFGRQRRTDLAAEGVSLETVFTFPDLPSGVAIIFIESGGQNRIAYVPGATWGVSGDHAASAIETSRPDVILATLEHQIPTLERLWQAARENGIPIVCNATPEPASGRDLALSAEVLIVNEGEAMALVGKSSAGSDWLAAARMLRQEGPSTVVITLGKNGAIVSSAGGETPVAAFPVEVIDTTGAGDAFCGAFTASFGGGSDLVAATRRGVIAGSLAVTKPGAQPSMPRRSEIEAALTLQAFV